MVRIGNEDLRPENLNGVYQELARYLGMDITKLIYRHYKGLQVNFPLRFLSKEYVCEQILKEFDGNNIQDLARRYEYSESTIRRMLKEHRLIPGRFPDAVREDLERYGSVSPDGKPQEPDSNTGVNNEEE